MPQIIVYDDISFYKCADGYYCNGKSQRIHRYKWEKEVGPIPEGYHIHHKDGDKDNNDLSNYELLHGSEHLRQHGKSLVHVERLAQCREKALRKAAEWHKTEEAREIGRKNWPISLGLYMDKKITKICEYCGKEFKAIEVYAHLDKWCGNNCKSNARRKSGVDNEVHQCVVCGKDIIVNKYSKIQACKGECATKLTLFKREGIDWRENPDYINNRFKQKKLKAKTLRFNEINQEELCLSKNPQENSLL